MASASLYSCAKSELALYAMMFVNSKSGYEQELSLAYQDNRHE